MSSVSPIVIKATAIGFNAERKYLNRDMAPAYLLIRKKLQSEFVAIKVLETNWKNRFSNFRNQMNLQIADENNDVVVAIEKCSDMAIGPYVYQIDKRDVYPPDAEKPWWDLFGTKTGELYYPPTP